jgi:hypothetical protein
MIPQWTDAMTGEPVVAPTEYELIQNQYQNQTWIGEWKIAVTSSSQAGWEYSRRRRRRRRRRNQRRHGPTKPISALVNTSVVGTTTGIQHRRISPLLQYTHRQRIWLRTIATTSFHKGSTTTVSKPVLPPPPLNKATLQQKNKKKLQLTQMHHQVIEAIQKDWNFKGFGMTFIKSVLYQNAFGLAFRIPLTLHFKTWERYPALPNIGSSIAIFLPQLCICLFINLSLRIEYIQMTLYYMSRIIPSVCTAVLLLLLRGLALAVSALLYPLTRQPLLLATMQEYDDNIHNGNPWWDYLLPIHSRPAFYPVRRNPESDERIDVTWSFRWSVDRGYEFRTTCSHFYAVPLATVIEAMIPLLPLSDNKRTVYSTTSIMKMMDWIPRHEAAIGCSFVGPAYHDKTGLFVTANTLLSLSGIYLFKQPKNRSGWKNITTQREILLSHDASSSNDEPEIKKGSKVTTTEVRQLYDDDSSSEADHDLLVNTTSLQPHEANCTKHSINAKVVVLN